MWSEEWYFIKKDTILLINVEFSNLYEGIKREYCLKKFKTSSASQNKREKACPERKQILEWKKKKNHEN